MKSAGRMGWPLYSIAIHSHGMIDDLGTNWEIIEPLIGDTKLVFLNESGDPRVEGGPHEDVAVSVACKAVWAKSRIRGLKPIF